MRAESSNMRYLLHSDLLILMMTVDALLYYFLAASCQLQACLQARQANLLLLGWWLLLLACSFCVLACMHHAIVKGVTIVKVFK
jgi:hypothetical protein